MNRLSLPRASARTLFVRVLASGALILALALCLPLTSQAQRRDFAASYRVSNVVETLDSVSLKLSVTIHNSSGSDISKGAIALYSSEGPRSTHVDSIELTKRLPSYKELTVSRELTISKHDYERWKLGENPNLKFVLPDSAGGSRIVPIDLRRETGPVATTR